MTRGRLIVIGAGGHAKVVVETAQASGWSVLGTADDNAEARVFDLPHLGPPEALQPESGVQCVIAIGSNETRTRLAERLSGRLRWAILLHPAAIVSSRASLGDGTVVFAGAVIQPGAQIGQQVIINTRASVDHDCHLGNGVHIGPGAVLTGGVNLGNGVFIGAGSVVSPGVTVGEWSTLGAGGVAIRDLGAHQTFVGVPARLITRADPRV